MLRGVAVAACVLAVASTADADPGKCVPAREPPLVANPRAKRAPCHKPPVAIQKAVRAELAKNYHLGEQGARLDVTFPCDGLGPRIREITLETGSGHGGTLELWHAQRAGGRYDTHGILFQRRGAALELATGAVALPGIESVRAGLAAKLREIAPPPKPDGTLSLSSSTSSRDFHIVVRLVDEEGRVLERRYTGYEGSGGQDTYLGLEIALGALAPITSIPSAPATPTTPDRAFFAQRFNAAVPHFDDEYYWWVMERFVELAGRLGTAAVIDGLLTRLTLPKDADRSELDARADAIEALATITGWDARDGGKTIEQAAASYLAECRP